MIANRIYTTDLIYSTITKKERHRAVNHVSIIRVFILFIMILFYGAVNSQNNYLMGNVQVNNMLDKTTYPSEIGFHYASQITLGAQIPLYINSTTSKEQLSLEMGIGKLVNSMYFKSTKNIGSGGVVDGFSIKMEPIFNIYQNKSKTLFIQASVNNVLYLFPKYESGSGTFDLDTAEVILKTNNSRNELQYAVEPNLGISYVLNLKKGGGALLFKLKSGYVFHEKTIANMSFSNRNESYAVKLNNRSWTFSVGYLINSKKRVTTTN